MNELALFAGAGGGILGGHLLGWRTVCAVERDAYAAQVLAQRQNDRALAPFPIWSDVCSFDGKPWRGRVDVVSGGFPCQDISAAGKGAGIKGQRSGLWEQMARIIREVQPGYVFVENSPVLTSRGLGRVLGDLAEMGFDAPWGCISAADLGAHHERERIWIVAYSHSLREQQPERGKCEKWGWASNSGQKMADAAGIRLEQKWPPGRYGSEVSVIGRCSKDVSHTKRLGCKQMEQPVTFGEKGKRSTGSAEHSRSSRGWARWPAEPDVGRVADGVANRVDRIKALGNGQVPRVAAAAFALLSEE
ncbi:MULTISPECIES: DNA cytosine methyltransferase [Vreelandella]|uniref:DNA cytosine methyltransferase n=1 Tax=Vreelandella venusta TaxID=44935 RepID=A0ABX2B8D7_9GAMM|nr:DNA cytosine methyltransferase [Halomonas venusta]NPT29629.1 DNA cytosine methyltransferase [Halomonas venusta]